ncbi:MAG: PhzF family phenazine biosynthesis protein [Clostridia bacterium]|nr:PhzF family phenazine biosynthesis protein [Clostridia bacterium]
MKQYVIDAFTSRPFSGNPAAVCVMDAFPKDASMMNLAMENALSETAFVVKEKDGYRLRWFTPGTEVALCGHATLASAFAVLTFLEPERDCVHFSTLSGLLTVRREGKRLRMDFPCVRQSEIPVTEEMEAAFGVRPQKALLGTDLVCVFESEAQVREMKPDQEKLMLLPGRIQNATAKGLHADCVSRSFAPKLAIPEDPVCGSAHCQIGPYWGGVLGKRTIRACQASRRGGELYLELMGDRIAISGEAVLVAETEIRAELA